LTQDTEVLDAPAGDPIPAHGRYKQYVTFLIGDRSYGVEIVRVLEIKQWSPTTALPNQPTHMRGVLNLRGTVVPVHDLHVMFGGPRTDATENHVVVITRVGDQTLGILVDAVSDIITVDSEDLRPVPASSGNTSEIAAISSLVAHDDGMVALIELDRLFEVHEVPLDR